MKLHQKKFHGIKDLLISKLGERVVISKEHGNETLELENSDFWMTATETELIIGYGINHTHYSEDFDNLESGIKQAFDLLTHRIRTTKQIKGNYIIKVSTDIEFSKWRFENIGISRSLFYPFWKKTVTEQSFNEKIIEGSEIKDAFLNCLFERL
ncbi:hypothetical protein [Elizabethkingia meningoseptica]|uniref:hypothetical protein n=1 Tax=Elizabethkingia meningoseptica TaxID=238 RepID=UPI00201192FB|nr:hypothetical protein [Elizabethkingia meningoseptica]MCL1674794.1 hypothetical protein [Elizabethkingia meningoseptica]MCL1685838.1 hypothetical protein [Elizabethkingia meningoseptica]